MKYFTIIASVLAVGLIAYNAALLDFNNPFEGESIVALITIVLSLCVILLLQILRFSKQVDQKLKGR
ncbi:hypothetical protein [Psychroserpens sp. Hel_I_66]|uniref:hypothetical protein n=1 Tax=Psychroserpens sp. Hel_I_66 TaxID=1250004 RepID=UPI000645D9EB|nr:hypothetical protein [Psychroserpens sp. Hel_I_66]